MRWLSCGPVIASNWKLYDAPLFQGLAKNQVEHVLGAMQPRRMEAGEYIFRMGDEGVSLYLVAEGRVHVFRNSLEGREKSLAFFSPGDVFGEMSLVEARPRSAHAVALEDTVVLQLFADHYRHLIQRYPLLAHNLARIIAERLRRASEEVVLLSFENARVKMAHALLKLYHQRLGRATERGWLIPETHKRLANHAGTSRETVTRVIREFKKEGLVEDHPQGVLLKDLEGLEAILWGL